MYVAKENINGNDLCEQHIGVVLMTTPMILLLGLCPTNTFMHVGKDVGTVLHTTARFVIPEDWNNPNVYQ